MSLLFQPKVTKKSHSFKSMPSSQRRVIHELAEFYGCQTESYDEEPNKNVVATAHKSFSIDFMSFCDGKDGKIYFRNL